MGSFQIGDKVLLVSDMVGNDGLYVVVACKGNNLFLSTDEDAVGGVWVKAHEAIKVYETEVV